jgi:DNA-binding transcriptional MerR regulator/methylmalonyl-CoA mutase cobalamin-binding subunit
VNDVSEARYRIGTLARLTGITTHALRVWERRYRALSPTRTPGGARLYTDHDVQRLRTIKKLLGRGYTISAVANLDLAALSRLAPPETLAEAQLSADAGQRARAAIEAILAAIAEMDMESAGQKLAQAANAFSPRDFVTQVVAPALDELGSRWASGEICTAAEHAASAMLRTHLGHLLATQPVSRKPPVVCTTPAGELHELGALLVAVIVAMHGRRAIYLGANLPADQIAQAVKLAKAGGVALSLVGLKPDDARRELIALCKALPAGVDVLVGGRRVAELPDLPERVQVLASLPQLEQWLLTAPR